MAGNRSARSPIRARRALEAAAPLAIALLAGACAPAPSGPAPAPAPTTTVAPNTPGKLYVTYALDNPNSGPFPLTVEATTYNANNYQPVARVAPGATSGPISVPMGQRYFNLGPGRDHFLSRAVCKGDNPNSDANVAFDFKPLVYNYWAMNVAPGETVRCTMYAHQILGTLTLIGFSGATVTRPTSAVVAPLEGSSLQYMDFVTGAVATNPYYPEAGVMVDLAITAPWATQIYCSYTLVGSTTPYRYANTQPGYRLKFGANEQALCSPSPLR